MGKLTPVKFHILVLPDNVMIIFLIVAHQKQNKDTMYKCSNNKNNKLCLHRGEFRCFSFRIQPVFPRCRFATGPADAAAPVQ